jgi:hypothetical protein
MNGIRFEWDEAKNRANIAKHGISFDEASRVFADPHHVSVPERIEDCEQRWQTFGIVKGQLLLMAGHTIREEMDDEIVEIVRIITARKATKHERRRYEKENR